VELILRKKDIETLGALGLTVLQAKIYLTLCKTEEANIITLSKLTNIARQEIYRVINELQNRFLVEKVLAKPVRYKCVPIEEAVPHLLHQINEERSKLNNTATQLIERYRSQNRKPFQQENENKFLLIPEKVSLSRRIKKAIEASQQNVKIVMPGSKFMAALFDLSHSLGAALERNLTVKWLINKRLDLTEKPSSLKYLLKFPDFKLRYISAGSLLTFGLYDENSLIVASNPKLNYVQSQAVWTNSVALVQLANNYFRTLWANSEINLE
jgi:sugar-specific transcriptional regulator TrmB